MRANCSTQRRADQRVHRKANIARRTANGSGAFRLSQACKERHPTRIDASVKISISIHFASKDGILAEYKRASTHSNGTARLSRCRSSSRHDPAAFPDGNDLVGFHLRESFEFARRRPLHLDEIYRLSFPEAEVQSQVALGHDTGSAMDLVDLNMICLLYTSRCV